MWKINQIVILEKNKHIFRQVVCAVFLEMPVETFLQFLLKE